MTRLDQAPDFADSEMEAKARERVPEIWAGESQTIDVICSEYTLVDRAAEIYRRSNRGGEREMVKEERRTQIKLDTVFWVPIDFFLIF